MRIRSPLCRGRGSRPCGAALHATSALRPRPRAPRRGGGRASRRSLARRGTTACGSGRRGLRRARARRGGGQLTSPSSSTAKRLQRLRDAVDIAEREHAPGEPVCRAEIARALPVQLLRPETVRRHAGRATTRCSPSRRARARDPRGSCRGCPTSTRNARLARSPRSAPTAARDSPATVRAAASTSRIPVSPIQRLRSPSSSGKSGGASSECSRYGT